MSGAIGTWIDGVEGSAVPADDRGLQYGDGLFETILLRGGRPRFFEAHLARLERGLGVLGVPFAFESALRADVAQAARRAPPLAVLKIVVTRGSATRRGYAPHDARPRRIVSLWPAAPLAPPPQGVKLRIATLRVADYSPLAGLKHLNRLENVLAAAECTDDSFDALLLDVHGGVVSATAANVFLVTAGELRTPRVDRAGVAGVLRGVVLRETRALGIAARECALTLADLRAADGVFLTNARIGVVPVASVGEHAIRMNPLVSRIAEHVETLDA